jgi:hypothetical protein
MPRPTKGQKTPGSGRKPGTLNKATLAEAACIRAGIDPFDLLVKGAIGGDMGAIIQLCKHIEPPRKALDVAIDPEKNVMKVIFEDYTKR